MPGMLRTAEGRWMLLGPSSGPGRHSAAAWVQTVDTGPTTPLYHGRHRAEDACTCGHRDGLRGHSPRCAAYRAGGER